MIFKRLDGVKKSSSKDNILNDIPSRVEHWTGSKQGAMQSSLYAAAQSILLLHGKPHGSGDIYPLYFVLELK